MARQDAEVAIDIGDDDADRPAADLGGDLLCNMAVEGCRLTSENRVKSTLERFS
jgi:hypothetical protein